MGVNYIKEKEEKLLFPLLSANLRSHSTGSLIFSPYIIKAVSNVKIGIFGLANDYDNSLNLKQKDIYIDSPLTSAQKAVKELQDVGCFPIMLLSQLSQADNKRVAHQVPGIHFILGNSSKTLLQNPKVVGETIILSPGTQGTHVAVLEIDFENDSVPFLNGKQREAVMEKIEELKQKEENPESLSSIEEVVLKRTLLEQKLRSFDGKNSYKYTVFTLDGTVKDDPRVSLLVEKYKEGRLRNRLSSYNDRVPTVDISSLPEEKRLMALRLMNEIACDEEGSIADSAAKAPFCRKLARMIVDSIKKGESEGKIRYSILYEKEKLNAEKLKISLDKDMQLQ
jgi:2',3'-cyclic-nucleotide 2'-phosphodiesterase (5'-nucleotidase family)